MKEELFSGYPQNSKIWVYQSARELTDQEAVSINNQVNVFLNEWDSHGNIVKSAYALPYNRFIVILADDTMDRLCGSAGDRLFQFAKYIDTEYNLSLMDRMMTSYRDGEEIKTVDINTFRELIKSGEVNEETTVFNNVVTTLEDFSKNWEGPLKNSWHKQLLEVTA